jgi:transposase InsO family protein
MDYIHSGKTVSQCSRHFDIPESTVRYWRNKFNPHNLSSLEDGSRKPYNVRRSNVPIDVVERVVELRSTICRGWAKDKLQTKLKAEGITVGQSRIQKIINSSGLKRLPAQRKRIQRKNRQHMYAVPKEVLKQPGGLVYLDVKHLTLPGGNKVYQFTAIDHATRILAVKTYSRITSICTVMFLDQITKDYPFDEIQYVGTDNGSEFLGLFDQELKNRDIQHVFSSPRSPKQNPFVERVIRTIIEEVYYFQGLEVTREQQQQVLDEYVNVYNTQRPHRSLEMRTPIEEYCRLKTLHSCSHTIS